MDTDEALKIVSKFFSPWCQLTEVDVEVTRLTGGLMNTVQLIGSKVALGDTCPHQVIIRTGGGGILHDSSIDERRNSPVEENIIFYQASNLGIAPKMYGVFNGGRLEEYVAGDLLLPVHCSDPQIRSQIAQVYAVYHSMSLPLSNDKFRLNYLDHVVQLFADWQSTRDKDNAIRSKRIQDEKTWKLIVEFDYLAELSWLHSLLLLIGSKQVFLHNDANYTNFIVRKETPEDGRSKIILIDFEWSMKGPRSLDLGAFFCNRLFDWPQGGIHSGYDILSREEREHFLAQYHSKCNELNGTNVDSLDHLIEEADLGILLYLIMFSALVLKFATFDDKFTATPPLFFRNYLKYKRRFLLRYKWPLNQAKGQTGDRDSSRDLHQGQ